MPASQCIRNYDANICNEELLIRMNRKNVVMVHATTKSVVQYFLDAIDPSSESFLRYTEETPSLRH